MREAEAASLAVIKEQTKPKTPTWLILVFVLSLAMSSASMIISLLQYLQRQGILNIPVKGTAQATSTDEKVHTRTVQPPAPPAAVQATSQAPSAPAPVSAQPSGASLSHSSARSADNLTGGASSRDVMAPSITSAQRDTRPASQAAAAPKVPAQVSSQAPLEKAYQDDDGDVMQQAWESGQALPQEELTLDELLRELQ